MKATHSQAAAQLSAYDSKAPVALMRTKVITEVEDELPLGGTDTLGQVIDRMLDAKQNDGHKILSVTIELPQERG